MRRSISGVNTTSASPAIDPCGIDENQLQCVGWVRRLHQKRQESGSRMGISREIKFAINSDLSGVNWLRLVIHPRLFVALHHHHVVFEYCF